MEYEDGIRPPYRRIAQWIEESGAELLLRRREEAEAIFRKIGITFAVYGEGGDPERQFRSILFPEHFRQQNGRSWTGVSVSGLEPSTPFFTTSTIAARSLRRESFPETSSTGTRPFCRK